MVPINQRPMAVLTQGSATQRATRPALKEGERGASTNSPPSRCPRFFLCVLNNAMQPISLQSVSPYVAL
ncbi:hypothetical protein, partial [Mesorhizobium sp. M7A.F.Ca.CA.003.01.2.1]|uniref:hypothetical protein n=1 Tax=Mesorhizobium sp. M7A.F.Ca.CA.003.01.2.1 TaxID=2496722 RepID=UPI001FE18D1B